MKIIKEIPRNCLNYFISLDACLQMKQMSVALGTQAEESYQASNDATCLPCALADSQSTFLYPHLPRSLLFIIHQQIYLFFNAQLGLVRVSPSKRAQEGTLLASFPVHLCTPTCWGSWQEPYTYSSPLLTVASFCFSPLLCKNDDYW